MSDTNLPVLRGLTLPETMDVSSGSRAVTVTATAADPGGDGVRHVLVYFDKELSQVQHHWTGYSSRHGIDGSFTQDSFSDATPGQASSLFSLTSLTKSGTYTVTKVAVEDMAGNRAVYSPAQLEAMGVNTTIQVSGGIDDKVAPSLRALSLPSVVNVGSGQASLGLTGEAQDNDGGAGVTHATITFDRPLQFSDGARSSVTIGSTLSSLQSGKSVTLGGADAILTSATASGTYQVTKLTVTDLAGNVSTYTPDQLAALGFNTSLTVTGGGMAIAPAATLSSADAGKGFAVTVASSALSQSGGDSFKLVLRYDALMAKFGGAVLAEGASGNLSSEVTENGAASTITITGSGAFPAASGIRITMEPLRENLASYLEVDQFTVNGNTQAFSAGKTSWMLQGSSADDLIYPIGGGVADGGAGFDTAMIDGGRSAASVKKTAAGIEVTRAGATTTLVNVERLAFGEDYLVFGNDSDAAQVYRLFRAAFDRAPDKTGLGYWLSQLEHGASLSELARGFIQSEEFAKLAGSGSSTHFFVSTLYRNVFDREPDEAGLRYWSNAIDTGMDRAQVLAAFSDSGENRAKVLAEIENGIEYTLW